MLDTVSVIMLTGAGRAFCSGWDLKDFAETPRPCLGSQNMPWGTRLLNYLLLIQFKYNQIRLWIFGSWIMPHAASCQFGDRSSLSLPK